MQLIYKKRPESHGTAVLHCIIYTKPDDKDDDDDNDDSDEDDDDSAFC